MNGALVRMIAAVLLISMWAGTAWSQTDAPAAAATSSVPAAPADPSTWPSLDEMGLRQVADSLASQGAAGQANRRQLINYLTAKYLDTVADTQSVKPASWSWWASDLKGDMTAQTKAQWATQLKAAFAPDATTTVALREHEFGSLIGALEWLGDAGLPTLYLWRVSGRYLPDPPALKTLGLAKFQHLAALCGPVLTDTIKAQWVAPVRAAFAPDQPTVAALSEADFGQLVDQLAGLGDKDVATLYVWRVSGTYLANAPALQALGLAKFQHCVAVCGPALTDTIKAQWVAPVRAAFAADQPTVAALSEADFRQLTVLLEGLSDKDLATLYLWRVSASTWPMRRRLQALGLAKFQHLAALCGPVLTDTIKAQWVAPVRAAFAPDQPTVAALSEADFGQLVDQLAGLGDKDVATLYVWRVSGTYLANAPALQALGLAKFQHCVAVCGPALTDTIKAQWVAPVRAAFAADQPTVTALSETDFGQLTGLLTGLGDKDVATLYLWRVSGTYLANAAALKTLGLAQFQHLAALCGPALTGSMQTQWVAPVRAAFAADQPTVAALSETDFGQLADELAGLGDKDVATLYLWRVSGTYLANAAALKTQGLAKFQHLAALCGPALTDAVKAQWVTQLRAAYAGDATTLAALKADDFTLLQVVLDGLGDPDTASLWRPWMAASDNWKTLGGDKLAALARELSSPRSQDAVAQRAALAAYLTTLYQTQPAAAVALGTNNWSGLAHSTVFGVSPDSQTGLAQGLRAAYTADPGTLTQLKAGELPVLVGTLSDLGDAHTGELLVQAMKASTAWQTDDLAWYLANLPTSGADALTLRQQVLAQAESRYLASSDSILAAGLAEWLGLVRAAGASLSPTARTRWAGQLKAAYLPNGTAGSLSEDDLVKLGYVLGGLGDQLPSQVTQTMLTIQVSNSASVSVGALKPLLELAAKSSDTSSLAPIVAQLDTACEAQFTTSGQLAAEDMQTLIGASNAVGKHDRAVIWARRVYNQLLGSDDARAQANAGTMTTATVALWSAGLVEGNTQEYPGFAQTAARLADAGQLGRQPDWAYSLWGWMVRGPQSRQTLQTELVDPQGNPRLPVAKVLAWAAYHVGAQDRAGFLATIETNLTAAGANGDTKALWLLVKGYAQALRPPEPRFTRSKPALDQALAAAASEPVRLTVVEEYTKFFLNMNQPGAGIAVLESLKGQFQQPASLERLAGLKEMLRAAAAARRTQDAVTEAQDDLLRKQARLQDCRRLLVQATASGDGASVSRLQATIQQLQQELGN